MFGKSKKNKKNNNVNPNAEEEKNQVSDSQDTSEDVLKMLGGDTEEEVHDPDENLTESQKEKKKQLDSVKSKISKILKSGNIEIVDENTGDEFDTVETSDSELKKQQDYDSLKAVFGDKNKKGKQELTLTIDDFDYTYVGKYLEEYDLIHKKNIKKIKLPSKALKIVKKVAIIIALIGALVGGVIFAISFTREAPYVLTKVELSQTYQEYYLNQQFDTTGIYFNLTYSNGKGPDRHETVPLSLKYLYEDSDNKWTSFYGRNSSIDRDKETIYFKDVTTTDYLFGFKYDDGTGGVINETSLTIKVKNKEVSGINALYMNSLFNLNPGDKISSSNLLLLVDYSNYNSELVNLKTGDVKLEIINDNKSTSCNKNDDYFVASVSTNENSVIKITYNGYSIELKKDKNAKGFINYNEMIEKSNSSS